MIITRTWTYTNPCGNFVTVSQTITVDDTQAPVFAAPPADITVECVGDVPAMTNLGWTDNCDGSGSVAGADGALVGGSCGGTITRTWTYTDACGNPATATQTITVDDTQAPVFAAPPADITVECVGDVPAMTNLGWTDNCDGSGSVAGADGALVGGSCGGTITRTWTYTDACGNPATATQTITVDDTQAPVFAAQPADITVECVGDVPAMTNLGWTDNCDGSGSVAGTDAADNSGVAIVTWEDDTSDGKTCPEIITRRYRVTDDCGNFILVEQTITVNDDTAPVGTAPAAITVQCIGDVPAADIAGVTGVSDNCTVAPVVAFVSDASDGNTCPEVITRTYSITDDCGNETLITQTITIDDDTAPVGTAPADVTVECAGDVPPADIAGVTGVSDNCTAAPVVAFVSDVTDGNTCAEVITRTYSITDDCGNVTFVTQTITIDDTTDPTASNPADIVVPGGPVPAPDPSVVTDAADNCTVNPVVAFVSDASDGAACPETITRIYSVTDDCGNQITVTQLILITDPFPPTASNPAPLAVQCIGDVPAPDPAVVTGAADNSGVAIVTWEDDTSDGKTCPEIITRRYRVTDVCGNFIFVEQTITVNDDIAPVGTAPADVTVACQTDVSAPNVTELTGVSDNCTVNPLVEDVSDVSDNNVCNGETITRTYRITDDCGNSITVTQLITISAVTPTFTISSSDPTTCGGTDGFITFSGLNPNEAYEFSFNGNAVTTINTDANGEYVLGGLSAGTYTSFQFYPPPCPMCSFTDNTIINLVDPNAPIIDAGQNQTVCEGEEVTLTAINPDGANITWNNGAIDGVPFISPVGTTQYVVTANLNNCISTDAVSVSVNPLPIVDAGSDVVICFGETVTLNGSGANSYVWDNGVTNGVPFVPTESGTYTVTGTTNNCSSTDDMEITVNPLSNVSFNTDDLTGCAPAEFTLTNTSDIQGEECEWILGNGVTLYGCDNVTAYFTSAGCFDVTLTVTTEDGCTSSATYGNYLCVQNDPIANFTADPLVLTTTDSEVNFTNGSVGAEDYEWNFGDGATSNEENPSHTFNNEEEGTYSVELIAYSSYGCSDTVYTVIEVQEDLIFYVPNTFTPDGNSYNETFLPIFTSGFDPYDFNLLIFNRWGEILFESNNHEIGWDGTYGGNIVKDGTYIWKIEFKTKYTDERQVHHGHVNLLR